MSWIHCIEACIWIWVGKHNIAVQSYCTSVLYSEYDFLSCQCFLSKGTEWVGGLIGDVWAMGI